MGQKVQCKNESSLALVVSDPHILLIGPRLNADHSNPGGATRSFEAMIDHFKQHGLPFSVINTQDGKGILRSFKLLLSFLGKVWKCDVVFLNLSQNGISKIAPLFTRWARLCNKKVVVRPFGSAMKELYIGMSSRQRLKFENSVLQADILYLQTRDLMDFFSPRSKRTIQLKTSRPAPLPELLQVSGPFAKRFAYMGQIKESKGINELLEVAGKLNKDYTLHIYGPIADNSLGYINTHPNYRGVLKDNEELMRTLAQYDVLLLPTYYSGEGYPGVVVEAYSLGLPVITTRWRSLPEIVEDGKTGLLIEPRSAEALLSAIESIDEPLHNTMSEAARAYFVQNFDQANVMAEVYNEVKHLVDSQKA